MKTIKYFVISLLFAVYIFPQVTGLNNWNIFLDPGHSQDENMGIYNYSEAKKVLRVALNLRDLLLSTTDIDTVYMCRTNDEQSVTLSQRTDYANSLGAAWYHSIHSNAGAETSNNVLLLWGQNYDGTEKVPNGGKAMSDIMVKLMSEGYRIANSGSRGDCSFYGTCSPGSGPYLHVNRTTTMPSELSEGGYHTNARQNQLNMNLWWKRLEAKTIYWTILKFKNLTRPFVGTAVGIVADKDFNTPINGAIVTYTASNTKSDTTDTYASLFNQYSSNPELLRNGFYYLEGLNTGSYQVNVTADGYDSYTGNVSIKDTFFTFNDISLISKVPPKTISITPANNDSIYAGLDHIIIKFSRPMNTASVQNNITFTPSANVTYSWGENDTKLTVISTNLAHNTNYQLKISGLALDKYNHPFDGDGNGVGGDDFTTNFRTKIQDVKAPVIVNVLPANNTNDLPKLPLINIQFDEQISTSTFTGRILVQKEGVSITTDIKYYNIDKKGTLNIFVKQATGGSVLTVKLLAGIKDIFGNPTTEDYTYTFTIGSFSETVVTLVDNFEAGIASWWQPSASGSTVGTLPQFTSLASGTTVATGSSKSMKLNYGWDSTASSWLLREYFNGTKVVFNHNDYIQSYIFGDGKNNKIRFCVDEDGTGGTYEVSPWITVDWIGWNLVIWNPFHDGLGSWTGDGTLQPPLKFDSYQMTYNPETSIKTGEYYFDDLKVTSRLYTGVEDETDVNPSVFYLSQNYPNPFNPSTIIRYNLPVSGNVTLKVYDILGNELSTLVDEFRNSGVYNIEFSAKHLSSGVYYYTLRSGSFVETKKMIVLK